MQQPFSGRREAAPASAKHTATRLALLPGSRTGEIKANWPSMFASIERIKQTHPQLEVKICAADDQRATLLQSLCPTNLPPWMTLVRADTPATLDWADAAVVVSGTATLQCVAHRVPMVTIFRVNPWSWQLAGRWLVQTRTFTLPNLISESLGDGRIVPELVPYFGNIQRLQQDISSLLADESARQRQRQGFEHIIEAFRGHPFATKAAQTLEKAIELL